VSTDVTYQYRCPKCRRVEEYEHGMKEEPDIYCKRCGQTMTRVITGGSTVIFPMSTRSYIK
jgi:putative FmdB family regulatory protein